MVNKMKRKVRIYQIPFSKFEKVRYVFMDWEFAKDKFSIKDYKLVAEWTGDIIYEKVEEYLENIFRLGNDGSLQKAISSKMRSISMSDVIEIDGVRWYCDTFGFKWAGTVHEI